MIGRSSLSRISEATRLVAASNAVTAQSAFGSLDAIATYAKPIKVVIVGSGLAGLNAAYELEQRGHQVTLLEAEHEHIGGRVRTARFGDQLYGELGAMRIPENHELTRHYVSKFGLRLRKFIQSNDEAYYYVRGRRTRIGDAKADPEAFNSRFDLPEPERKLTPGDIWERAVTNVLNELKDEEKADLNSPDLQTETVRRLDQQSLQQLLEAAAFSPEAIELLCSTWGLETMLPSAATEHLREEMHEVWIKDFDEIEGGTDCLPRAFVANLQSKPRLGCEVIRIEQDVANNNAAAIYLDNGKECKEEGDFLLCTIPASVLSRIEVNPPFSGAKQRAIRQLNYDSSTKVLGVARRRFCEADDGIFGGGTATDLPTAFTYYPSDNATAKDPQVSEAPGVLLASYTWGHVARRLAVMHQAEAEAFVTANVAKFHPQLASEENAFEGVTNWSWDTHKWSCGAFAWFLPGQHTSLHGALVAPEGRILLAGEHASLTHTWMQDAFESALKAVAHILQTANVG